MGWFEDLKNRVWLESQRAKRGTSQVSPTRMAGQFFNSSFVRPTIGFKPEIGGTVLSLFLPEDNPVKKVLDTGLYLGSGALSTTLGLAGSASQNDDPFDNWKRLGYVSKDDMIRRVSAQAQIEAGDKARVPGVYSPEDYGPPRAAGIPPTTPPAPPEKRPVEEDHPPITGKVPPTPTPSPEERTQENDLARFYAKTHMRGAEMAKGGELQRRLWESGEMRGMTPETLMSWVEANPGVAYREAQRRGLLPEYETASFQ